MGDNLNAEGAFKGQKVPITPLIGKLRLHIQGYVDKEDFLISPLKNEDVLLGAPWFDRLGASMKFPERQITFSLKGKNVELNVNALGHTIPVVNNLSFHKSI